MYYDVEFHEWLETLKVGDQVIIDKHIYGEDGKLVDLLWTLSNVASASETSISVTDGGVFLRSSGGNETDKEAFLLKPSESRIEDIRHMKARRKAFEAISKFKTARDLHYWEASGILKALGIKEDD